MAINCLNVIFPTGSGCIFSVANQRYKPANIATLLHASLICSVQPDLIFPPHRCSVGGEDQRRVQWRRLQEVLDAAVEKEKTEGSRWRLRRCCHLAVVSLGANFSIHVLLVQGG